jgi:arabinose-5-phosphate isomerase
MTGVVDAAGKLTGIYTDGDLRRTLSRNTDFYKAKIADVMIRNPKTIGADTLAAEAVAFMQSGKINGLIVVDADHKAIGAFNMQDLLRAGVV